MEALQQVLGYSYLMSTVITKDTAVENWDCNLSHQCLVHESKAPALHFHQSHRTVANALKTVRALSATQAMSLLRVQQNLQKVRIQSPRKQTSTCLYMTFRALSDLNSVSVICSRSLRTSSVCCPRSGPAHLVLPGVLLNTGSMAGTVTSSPASESRHI